MATFANLWVLAAQCLPQPPAPSRRIGTRKYLLAGTRAAAERRQPARVSAVQVHVVDQLLSPTEVGAVVDAWHRYRFYDAVNQRVHPGSTLLAASPSAPESELQRPARFSGLIGRADVDLNFERQHARAGAKPLVAGVAYTNYFRANYIYRDQMSMPDFEGFLRHDALIATARQVFDRPLIVPSIVYANVLVPGQELPVHTDVPEFIGADRRRVPLWLLVVMHHSGLFEDRRIAIATAVTYVTGGEGGDFLYHPNDQAAPSVVRPDAGNGVVFDADSVFHAISPVGSGTSQAPHDNSGMRLTRDGKRSWRLIVRGPGEPQPMASYTSDELRYSVSWKAYCYADEHERRAVESAADVLEPDHIVERLVDDLVERGRLAAPDHGLSDHDLAILLIDEFIPFPSALPG